MTRRSLKVVSAGRGHFHLTEKKRFALSVTAGFLALLLGLGVFAAVFIHEKLDRVDNEGISTTGEPLELDGKDYDETAFTTMSGDIMASSFENGVKEWATNGGEVLSSKNVFNVLLVGYDNRDGENEGNTDVMMLLSCNLKTKSITLASFLRDTWVYYETADGKTGYDKLNALYAKGGVDCLLFGIENHYKISADRYVAVNFASFQALIDEMGGIEVAVQKYEANYYNMYYKEQIPYGDSVHLDGAQTLGFCRIRKCDTDGDVSRTRRQQLVVQAIIKKFSALSPANMNDCLNVFLPYVKTNLSDSEILSVGTKAAVGRWYDYPVVRLDIPDENARLGYSGKEWFWVTDFPLAAGSLQTALYGRTNIELSEDRVTLIDIFQRTR